MSLANNDVNWRLVAAEAIEENRAVTVTAAGKVAKTQANPVGIVPQAIAIGERAPVIRHGVLGGLVGFTAGDKLRPQADGSLATAGSSPVVAIVRSEDATTAVILSGNLDNTIS